MEACNHHGDPKEKYLKMFHAFAGRYDDASLLTALGLLEKLMTNIALNPKDPKYRSIKRTNPTLQSQLFNVRGVEELLLVLGFCENGEFYTYSSEDLRPIVPFTYFIGSAKEAVKERSMTPKQLEEKREKERRIAEEKAAFEKARQEKLKLEQQFKYDMAEKKDEKVTQDSRAVQRKFGAEAKGFKEIGVDLNKQPKGG